MADHKSGRMASDVQRIIMGILPDLKDPRIKDKMLTVVRVDMTGDCASAKVYVSSVNGFDEAKEAVKGLENAKGFIRREISGVLHIRKAPELKFIADDSTEYSARISKMLKELDVDSGDNEVSEDDQL